MERPENMKEPSLRLTERTIYIKDEIKIPGLNLFGHGILTDAREPLILHYHERVLEFTIAVKGGLTWTVEKDPPRSYSFHGGDIFVSYPEEPHSGRNLPLSFSEFYWFQLDPTAADSFLFLCPEASRYAVSRLLNLSGHIIHTSSAITHPLIKQIFSLLEEDGDRYQIAAHTLSLLYHLFSASTETDTGITEDIKMSLSYIQEHVTEPLTIEELASISRLSVSHFQQKFKKQLGLGPRHYINQQKIEYSKKLLLSGCSVTETAMLLGYNTSGYFSTVFKKYTMYSPIEFLKRRKQAS